MGNKYTTDQVDLVSSHPNFTNAQVITQKENRFIKTVVISNDQGYSEWKKLLSKHEKVLASSHSLLLPLKHSMNKQGLCSDSGKVQIDYEYFPYILSEEIANRHQKQQRFRESDLWYLLYSLCNAKHQTMNLSQRVGDIKPQNVFIDYDGQVKVGSIYSYPNEQANYHKALSLKNTLLAPQDLDLLQLGSTDNKENQHSETFSIGLTVIAAGILEDPSSIYDLMKFTFNSSIASDFINKWKNTQCYSQVFRSILINLVEFKPQNRLNFNELWQFVSKYQPSIKSKQKFLITSVPSKIQHSISVLRASTKSAININQYKTFQRKPSQIKIQKVIV